MIQVLIVLVILGVALWLVETYVPLSPPIRMIIRVVAILFALLYVLGALGVVRGVNLR